MEVSDIRSVKHCILCQKRNYVDKVGTLCSLTNERAHIENDCDDFEFREDIDEYILSLKDELKEAERDHIIMRKLMIRWFFIGLVLTISGLIFWTMPWNRGAIHILTVSLIIIGIILMPQGAWDYFPHRMRLKAKHFETQEFLLLAKHYKEKVS